MRNIVAALALTVFVASPLSAQVRYKDNEGVTHWVDSVDQVPEQYRSGAIGRPTAKGQPSSSSSIDWERKARDLEREREQRVRDLEQREQAEQAERQRQQGTDAIRRQYQRATDEAEAARQAVHTVTYVVSGSASSASVTYANGQGGTAQQDVQVPWQTSVSAQSGGWLYLSAMGYYGDNVTVQILVDGREFRRSAASTKVIGSPVLASAHGSCC